jgi:two-component system, NarL family, invasion response regulator UvrY
MTRILLVDDHELVRKGIIQVLAGEFPGGVFEEASNAVDALNAVWNHTWDLVLLDIGLPGRGGMELLKEIKAARPRLPVLILSGHPEEQFSTRALRAGAAGYLTKTSLSDTLVRAVCQVLGGGKFISQKAAEMLALELNVDGSRPAHEQLSDREHDVLIRIAGGQGVSEIAHTLSLSVKTVSTYRSRVLDKMGMKNNSELTHYAIRNGLVD